MLPDDQVQPFPSRNDRHLREQLDIPVTVSKLFAISKPLSRTQLATWLRSRKMLKLMVAAAVMLHVVASKPMDVDLEVTVNGVKIPINNEARMGRPGWGDKGEAGRPGWGDKSEEKNSKEKGFFSPSCWPVCGIGK